MNIEKRLLVYFFWDADGIVDDYVIHTLRSLGEYSSSVAVVVNGVVNADGYQKLKAVSNHLILRENTGMDAWAYKTAFEHLGYEHLRGFDEVLITNFTLFGPLFSLADTFGKMDATPCDFWGLAGYNEIREGHNEVHHLQSYFVAYRRSLTSSQDFYNYWANLPNIESYVDSIKLHELAQTPYFSSRGYTYESLLSTKKYKRESPANFVISCAERVLIEDHCPFIKRRAFFFNNGHFEQKSSIEKIEHITNFIKSRTDYDITMILSNIERTQKSTVSDPRTPIARYKHIYGLFGSYIHPNKTTRRALRKRHRNATNQLLLISSLWKRYLDCFRFTKPITDPMQLLAPSIQHLGRYTYIAAENTRIVSIGTVIGDFCSIGKRVTIGHGNHPKDFLSSSPYFYFDELGFKSPNMPTYDKYWYIEPVIIGNDVWIGDDAWIKNGVIIGDGAIIGAGAVVTKNVPPYSIVAGVPADVISYRFDEKTIRNLLDSEWWSLPDDVIRQIPFDNVPKALSFLSKYMPHLH